MRDREGRGKLIRKEGVCVCVMKEMRAPSDEKGGRTKCTGKVNACGREKKAMQIEPEKWCTEKDGSIRNNKSEVRADHQQVHNLLVVVRGAMI